MLDAAALNPMSCACCDSCFGSVAEIKGTGEFVPSNNGRCIHNGPFRYVSAEAGEEIK